MAFLDGKATPPLRFGLYIYEKCFRRIQTALPSSYTITCCEFLRLRPSTVRLSENIDGALGSVFSTPAYFNGTLYYGDSGSTLKAFKMTNAKLGASPQSQSATQFASPGTAPSLSANGTANAIVWAHENTNPAVLHAFDASSLAIEVATAPTIASCRSCWHAATRPLQPSRLVPV